MNDEELLECVRKYPVIYDMSHPKYLDNRYKNIVWKIISQEIKQSGQILPYNMTIVHATSSITSPRRTEQLTEEEIDLFRKCIEFAANQKNLQHDENKVEMDYEPIEDTAMLVEKGVSIKEASGKSKDPQTKDVSGEATEKVNKTEKGIVDGGKCL